MALRGHCGQSGAASSWNFVYSGAGNIAVGDLVIVATYQNGGTGAFTVTGPGASFTAGTALSPTVGGTVNGNQWGINVAIAAAGDVGTPTYATSSSVGGGSYVQQILVYSGRVHTSIAAAYGNSAQSTQATPGSNPYTYAMTGLTALANDDIIIVNPIGPATGTGQTFTTSASGYTDMLDTTVGTTNTPALNSLDSLNVAGGATGTINVQFTATGGSANNWLVGGFVMALPASSAQNKTWLWKA